MTTINETAYERNQRFNRLVLWLHSFRYRNILEVFDSLSAEANGEPVRVVEIGCAHAKLFSILDGRVNIDYIGIEPKDDRAKAAAERYGDRPNFQVIHDNAQERLTCINEGDVVVALETMEHIPESLVVRLVEQIAGRKPKRFICSVPVEVGPAIWFKNIGSLLAGYMRHKEYSWRETFWAGMGRLDKIPPHWRGHKGFDWRWLAQTIRHNMNILEIRRFPVGFMPAWLSTSVFFIAEPAPRRARGR